MTDAEVGEKIVTLERVANGNCTVLYRDPTCGKLWEQFYPHSEMHGGGPGELRPLTHEEAAKIHSGL